MKKNGMLVLLLAAVMLCSLVGCAIDNQSDTTPSTTEDPHAGHSHNTTSTTTEDPHTGHSHDTTSSTTTTTAPAAPEEPLTLTVGKYQGEGQMYKDVTVGEPNYSLKLTAQQELTQLRLISINPDSGMPDKVLCSLSGLKKGESQYILTYINDAVPNRGVICVDKQGKTTYYAFAYSGQTGDIYLSEIHADHS